MLDVAMNIALGFGVLVGISFAFFLAASFLFRRVFGCYTWSPDAAERVRQVLSRLEREHERAEDALHMSHRCVPRRSQEFKRECRREHAKALLRLRFAEVLLWIARFDEHLPEAKKNRSTSRPRPPLRWQWWEGFRDLFHWQ